MSRHPSNPLIDKFKEYVKLRINEPHSGLSSTPLPHRPTLFIDGKGYTFSPFSWAGIDLDGTLAGSLPAHFVEGLASYPIGPVIPEVKELILFMEAAGLKSKILTGRLVWDEEDPKHAANRNDVRKFLHENGLPNMEIRSSKDPDMFVLFDDRAIGLISNKGKLF